MTDKDAELRAADKAREENVQIFQALHKLKRYGLSSNDLGASSSLGTPKDGAPRQWKRTWGSLVTSYGKREEARLHVAIRPFLHMPCASAEDRDFVLQKLTRSLQRVGVFPLKGFKDVFEVVGATESDGCQRIQIFFNRDGVEEYLMLS